jgi:metacaspase-1
MKLIRIIFFILLPLSCFAQKQHALIVAIGEYPNVPEQKKNWSDLSSKNDADILQKALLKQGFEAKNIHVVSDSLATKKNIDLAFRQLTDEVKPGDVVWFHFSGHGQQIQDLNKDEPDGYDEALITYAAPTECVNGYLGEDHLLDDELQQFFSRLAEKLGPKGHLLVTLDACHSGTASRGVEDLVRRGTDKTFDFSCHIEQNAQSLGYAPPKTTEWEDLLKEEKNKASMVVISGCTAQEVNYEYKVNNVGYGTLTFALCEAMNNAQFNQMTYQQMFILIRQIVQKNMLKISQYGKFKINQSPQFEGNIHSQVLNGTAKNAASFFEVSNTLSLDIEIMAGQFNGISVGDSIDFSLITEPHKNIQRGVVTEVTPQQAVVHVGQKILEKNAAKYQATVGYSPVRITPILLYWSGNTKKKKEILPLFTQHPNIQWTENKEEADYLFVTENKTWMLQNPQGKAHRNMAALSLDSISTLHQWISQLERVEQFKKLELVQSTQNIDWDFIAVEKCESCEVKEDLMDFTCIKRPKSFYKKTEWKDGQKGVLQKNHLLDMIVINHNDKPKYLSVINFMSDGSLAAGNAFKLPTDLLLQPHVPFHLIMNQNEIGEETYKYIISEEPLHIENSSIIIDGAQQAGKRGIGDDEAVLSFLAPVNVGTRGINKNVSIEIINFQVKTVE